jgi:lauroyl/myristoyl acyltransferase
MQRRGLNIRKALLRLILPAVRKLPPRTASRFVAGIGRTEYAMGKTLRVRFDHAVKRGAAYFGTHWDVSAVGRELAGNQIRWRTRDQLLDGLGDEAVASVFEVVGKEHLDAAVAQGKGVILLGNHFGAHLMPAHWLVRQGYPLRLFMERPHHISKFLSKEFETDGPLGQKKLFISRKADPTEAAGSILRAGRVLKAGMVVMIAGDVRWAGQHTAEATFLGNTYRFSATWVTLGALTGAPVLPVFCRMGIDGSHTLEFEPSFRIPNDGAKPGRLEEFVQPCLARIEERVREYPDNSNDYFFWDDPEEAGANAARTEARRA